MIQLWAWEYKGMTQLGYEVGKITGQPRRFERFDNPTKYERLNENQVHNLRKVKVVDETEQKTYLTTEQFIKVFKSLSDEKSRELSKARNAANPAAWNAANSAANPAAWNAANSAASFAAWNAANSAASFAAYSVTWYAACSTAWSAARSVDLAVLAKDAITPEHFNILTSPWTSCGLSLYAEDWEAVLNPKVEEPKNFGAVVEAKLDGKHGIGGFPVAERKHLWKLEGSGWELINIEGFSALWCWFIDPVVISEGQK